jgi:hypothetical protein
MESNAPNCLRVVIPLVAGSTPLVPALQIGPALVSQVRKMNGRARCLRTPGSVIVEESGVPRGEIETLIDGIDVPGLEIYIEERDSPEFDLHADGILRGELTRVKLTKKFMLGLPDDAIVVGNLVVGVDGIPNLMARLSSGADREEIWRRAVDTGAAQGICNVYWNDDDALAVHKIDPDAWNLRHTLAGGDPPRPVA